MENKNETRSIILLFVCVLLLAISNITNVTVAKSQREQIKSLKNAVDEVKEDNDKYKEEIKNLERELKLFENDLNEVKKKTDKIADKLAEVEPREETEENLEVATEELPEKPIEVKSAPIITTEEVTTEEVTTEEVTTEEVTTEEITTEEEDISAEINTEQTYDIPWIVYEVVECEVHGGDKESKMHVAHVIRNRVNSGLFPDNYYDVCTEPYQFGSRSDVEQSTIDAVNEAMSIGDTTGGALFFHSMEWMSSWGGYDYIFTDNVGHHFYGN